jgi:hypothetical protein
MTKMKYWMVVPLLGIQTETKSLRDTTKTEKKTDFGLNGQKMERKHSKVISKTATNNSFFHITEGQKLAREWMEGQGK